MLFESFRFQDAIRTTDWKSCTFKEYLFVFRSSISLERFKMEPADINNDILVGVACVPQLNGSLSITEIITHEYHPYHRIAII